MLCKVTNSVELYPNARKCAGFLRRPKPVIISDSCGFKKMELPRNTITHLQTSLYLLQSWRANVDIQLLLYEHDPDLADAHDIAKATDYIFGYISKGYEKQIVEKQSMLDLIKMKKK